MHAANKAMNTDIDNAAMLLERAVEAVRQETGLRLTVGQTEVAVGDQGVDAHLRLEATGQTLAAAIKPWAQHANLGALVQQIKQLPGEALLVADYVNPRMAERLRDQRVQFIDTAGNAYVDQPPVYVYVTGKRPATDTAMPPERGIKRAFDATGLRVIYAFLRAPELVHAPYRTIAAEAGVAVGTVGWVINGLKAARLVHDGGRGRRRRLVDYQRLLERWVEAYPERLKPKLWLGAFGTAEPDWWQPFDIKAYGGCWGGEVAAARYTRHLKPQVATVYLPQPGLADLVRDARLRKADGPEQREPGTVLIYQPFWPREGGTWNEHEHPADLVHPLVAYADLVGTGEPRNLEAAQALYDAYLAQYRGKG